MPMMKIGTFLRAALLLAAALFIGHSAVAKDVAVGGVTYSNKWRIKCDEGADNHGNVLFRITVKGQEPIDVRVYISRGRSENGVAKDITAMLDSVLDKKRFHVERDDWEDVLIKKRGDGPDFTVQVIESTLQGTHFVIELD
jgi:hypothetical protein